MVRAMARRTPRSGSSVDFFQDARDALQRLPW